MKYARRDRDESGPLSRTQSASRRPLATQLIALAGEGFDPATIDDRDAAVARLDRAGVLEGHARDSDAGSLEAERLGETLLR